MDNHGTRGIHRAFLLLLVGILAAGCVHKLTRTLVSPDEIKTLDARSPFLKAHLANGNVYVLSQWHVDSSKAAILGRGSLLDTNRMEIESGTLRVPTDSVVLYETNVIEASNARRALTIMAGVTAAVAGMCAASPKTCFGSCPTFYAPREDGTPTLQAETFSASIAPGLEATDIDMLLHTKPTERDYTIQLTNEALETHVIRYADLLAAPREADERVYVTSDGVFRKTSHQQPPIHCQATDGDCLEKVIAADGEERFSLTDSTDLSARETVDLEFGAIGSGEVGPGEMGLVLVSRQTLLTTFLIYQALAYMGNDAGRWLAALETGGEAARLRAGTINRVLGTIEVLVQNPNGEWIVAGSVGETGPIASDTRIVSLPESDGSSLRVRLRMTRGLWRLDQIALVSLGDEVQPVRLRPTGVTRDGVPDHDALRNLVYRESPLVTGPGDAYELSYRLPENPEAYEYFLEARGYYLEWMRTEWLAEENPLLAAGMVLNPGRALRALAPAFKKQEPEIEHLFWNSRYVGK